MRRPTALTIVASFFILAGISAAIAMLGALIAGRQLPLDFNIIGLWIGPGLLRFDRRAFRWAELLLRLGLILVAILVIPFLLGPSELPLKVFGRPAGAIPKPAVLAGLVGLFVCLYWQHAVLERPAVRRLFELSPERDDSASPVG